MTGQELFYALSFVDERYIEEAETVRIGAGVPWKKLLSVAACLCILIAGAFAIRNFGYMGVKEEAAAPEAAAPAAPAPEVALDSITDAAPEAAPEPEAAPREEEAGVEPISPDPGEGKIPAGELHHISYARLRVTNLNDDGSFEAIVEETDADAYTDLFEAGMQATVIVDSTKVPGAKAEVQNDLRILHTDAQIEIRDGAYDAGLGELYVAEVTFLCRDDH